MTLLHLERALLPRGWAADVLVEVGADGVFGQVLPDSAPGAAARVPGLALPGLVDLHSHSFQRAMAGLAEGLPAAAGPLVPGERQDFWTWRRLMYGFLERIGPDELLAITAQLYVELLKGGYTAVCEFHYLHNDPAGQAYDEPGLLAVVVDEAAAAAGIGLTLLPSLYQSGGFGGLLPEPGQRRFTTTLDAHLRLLERLDGRFAGRLDRRVGSAPHSLRAIPVEVLAELVKARRATDPLAPIHIHIAEQEREVADCLAWGGARPAALLLDRLPVDRHWCLIHCTHLDDSEVAGIARSGAVVGLCPTTEANLGDGVFRLTDHLAAGGRLGVGSDSNVGRAWPAELRLMEYVQRLMQRRRAVATGPGRPSPARTLFEAAAAGGAAASGLSCSRLEQGARADLVVIDLDHPDLVGRTGDALLDSLVFSGERPAVRDVMVAGRWRVRDGVHPDQEAIAAAYRRTVRQLLA